MTVTLQQMKEAMLTAVDNAGTSPALSSVARENLESVAQPLSPNKFFNKGNNDSVPYVEGEMPVGWEKAFSWRVFRPEPTGNAITRWFRRKPETPKSAVDVGTFGVECRRMAAYLERETGAATGLVFVDPDFENQTIGVVLLLAVDPKLTAAAIAERDAKTAADKEAKEKSRGSGPKKLPRTSGASTVPPNAADWMFGPTVEPAGDLADTDEDDAGEVELDFHKD